MVTEQSVEMQAKVYVFDLNNCAREFGFKPNEVWEINLATQAEKLAIEKNYYPTIVTKVLPDAITKLFGLVKTKVAFATSTVDRELDGEDLPENILQYLVAFIPDRKRE